MEVAVSSEDDAEVRRVSVTNHGSELRELEITSYAELILAANAADAAHPAFSNMFVETSFHCEFDRATMLAWTQAQVQLRHLGLHADADAVFQRIANRLIYADTSLRAPPAAIAGGAAPVSLLWQHGISGDRPIVLVTVEQQSDLDLVRRLLLAHEYWGLKQLCVNPVILNEQTHSYAQQFEAELVALVNANRLPRVPAVQSAKGTIFVLREGLVSARARALLAAASRAVFSSKLGSLAGQLAWVAEPKIMPAAPLGSATSCRM